MEVALGRTSKILSIEADEDRGRRHIASRILECAERGDRTLGGLTDAGCMTATERCSTHGV
jgi:hypothetical protein